MDPLRASNKLRRLIRAYHGSPHSFSRFDASKIGTGEGAQSYGHGLYFAGGEHTADTYRRMLAGDPKVLIGGRSAFDLRDEHGIHTPEWRAITQLWSRAKDSYGAEGVRHAVDITDDYLRRVGDDQAAEALRGILSGRSVALGPRPGHMYEVEIGYPEEALLDWDGSVMPAGHAVSEAGWGRGINTGSDLWQAAARDMGPLEASLHFKLGGIPGIRYLDQGSRSAGEGTRNYVMFPGTEDRIRILRKYGLLPPLAGAGAMGGEE